MRVRRGGALLWWVGAAVLVTAAGPASAAPSNATAKAERAIAQSINLKATDFPSGWTETPNPPNAAAASLVEKAAGCLGPRHHIARPMPRITAGVDASSAKFTQASTNISSNVRIVSNPTASIAALKAYKDPKLPACFGRTFASYLQRALATGGVRFTFSKINFTSFAPAEALPNSLEIRFQFSLAATAQGHKFTSSFTGNQILFVVGRADVSLEEDQIGPVKPIPIEGRLIGVLESRAKAAGAL